MLGYMEVVWFYVSLPTLFACFLGFDVPTSFIFIENVFYYSFIITTINLYGN